MSAGRRGLLLSVAFLGLAGWLCAGRSAHAQPRPTDPGTGRHSIWKQELRPDQIRDILSKFGQDDGKNDWFEKMIFDAVKEKNKNLNLDDEQVKSAVKKMLADKEFMDRVTDIAQKQKNQMKDTGPNGPAPKFTQEDLAKIAKLRPNGEDPFKIPDDPNRFLPFDPRNPNFDPDKFPAIDPNPKNPPKIDPQTRLPLDPNTGRPFDPRNGGPIDPKNPPRFDPAPPQADPKGPTRVGPGGAPGVPPKMNPMDPPPIDPKTGRPMDPPPPVKGPTPPAAPPNDDGKRKFDPENPLGTPKDSPEKAAKTKAVETATALWEKNVGPIEESPAVKRAIIDLVSDTDAMDALTDDKGRNIFDAFDGGDDKFGDLMGNDGDSNWEWPKFDWNWGGGRNLDVDLGESRPRNSDWASRPRSSSGGSGLSGPGLSFGAVTVSWPLLLILLALVVAAVVWWKWADIIRPRATAAVAGGPGPWPIDPRDINTREDVVKAFEYLSVLICGPDAKTWTHSTIADELTALAATHGETAVKLARLYELARYAPLDEPLTRAELMEARRLACDLAGIDEV